MRIIRVFPRRTNATPTDELAVVGMPRYFDEADEVHISVTFTWDLPTAEKLRKEWRHVADTIIGGPATGQRGGQFEPGIFLKRGYVITSRGCPNRCWFCSVWRRDGNIKELEIRDGWNVLDDNLLACSNSHIDRVFDMLKKQTEKAQFTGGLEAKRLKKWHCERLRDLRPKQIFFAYDTPDDLEPLREAGKLLLSSGFTRKSKNLRCYVLCGYPKDTIREAECRMTETIKAGFVPSAMLWRSEQYGHYKHPEEWRQFQRRWIRPAMIDIKIKQEPGA